jgi:hypothetical protein
MEAERDRQLVECKQKSHLLHADEHMGWAAKALLAGVIPVLPERIWEALDVLAKAREKAGYPRPSRGRGRPSKNETSTPDDQVVSLYDDPMLAAEVEDEQEWVTALPNFIPLPPTARKGKGSDGP